MKRSNNTWAWRTVGCTRDYRPFAQRPTTRKQMSSYYYFAGLESAAPEINFSRLSNQRYTNVPNRKWLNCYWNSKHGYSLLLVTFHFPSVYICANRTFPFLTSSNRTYQNASWSIYSNLTNQKPTNQLHRNVRRKCRFSPKLQAEYCQQQTQKPLHKYFPMQWATAELSVN